MSEKIVTAIEEWRPVKGFEGLYSVSKSGLIRNERIAGRILKGCLNRDGYRKLCLRKNGRNFDLLLHRALLFAFHEPPKPGQNQCNHKNGNKDDNRFENIEWCSEKENRIRFGIRPKYVWDIAYRKTWKHVDPEDTAPVRDNRKYRSRYPIKQNHAMGNHAMGE